jgi:two-component system, chemotaxis family, protein-glutamate methylesterase/glutaminase
MPAIRILVVDDSVVIRKLLCEIMQSDPELEVAGTASDGKIGLAKIAQLQPDLVTLDVEMPVLNGLQTLAEIRKLYPRLPVVMFSTLTERGAEATLDALSLGASDYVAKPVHTSGPAAAVAAIKAELIPKIKALCAGGKRLLTLPPPRPPIAVKRPVHRPIEIVAIGTSTGGPNALAGFYPSFPKLSQYPSFSCNICLQFLRVCWRNGWAPVQPSPWPRESREPLLLRDMPGSRPAIFT